MAPFPLCCVAGLASAESVATLAAAATGLAAGRALGAVESASDFKDANAPLAGLLADHKKIVARGNRVTRPLVMLGAAAAAASAATHRDKHAAAPLAVAAASSAVAILISLTLVKRLEADIEALPPTNASPSKKDTKTAAAEGQARELLQKWARLHSVRAALVGFAFGSTLCGVLLLNKKH